MLIGKEQSIQARRSPEPEWRDQGLLLFLISKWGMQSALVSRGFNQEQSTFKAWYAVKESVPVLPPVSHTLWVHSLCRIHSAGPSSGRSSWLSQPPWKPPLCPLPQSPHVDQRQRPPTPPQLHGNVISDLIPLHKPKMYLNTHLSLLSRSQTSIKRSRRDMSCEHISDANASGQFRWDFVLLCKA